MTTFLLRIEDPESSRGEEPSLSFDGRTNASLATALADALRSPALFQRWLALQEEPDEVDESLGAVDAAAQVTASEEGSRHYLEVQTRLPHALVSQRLNWLIGSHWTLRDVR